MATGRVTDRDPRARDVEHRVDVGERVGEAALEESARRYSMFHVVQPFSASSTASARVLARVNAGRQKPP